MPLFQYSAERRSPGDIVGDPEDRMIYKVLSVSDVPWRTPGGSFGWRTQLVRATDEEATVFSVMES